MPSKQPTKKKAERRGKVSDKRTCFSDTPTRPKRAAKEGSVGERIVAAECMGCPSLELRMARKIDAAIRRAVKKAGSEGWRLRGCVENCTQSVGICTVCENIKARVRADYGVTIQ